MKKPAKKKPVAAARPKPAGPKPSGPAPKVAPPAPEQSIFEEEPKTVHTDMTEDIGLPEDLEEEMPEDVSLEDEEAEPDYLDKPEDLSGDNDDYRGS
jgi:hypothetical protein